MNGVSDITFLRPLSTQDKHICCIVIGAKKYKREGMKERRKRGKEGSIKESTTYYYYKLLEWTLSCSKKALLFQCTMRNSSSYIY